VGGLKKMAAPDSRALLVERTALRNMPVLPEKITGTTREVTKIQAISRDCFKLLLREKVLF